MNATPKLSRANKMPCKSWSLQALDTCPGAKAPDGGLVPACQGCYAVGGNYRFKVVKATRTHNRQDWKASDWVSAMVKLIDGDTHFRWFDSGDCYAHGLAVKMLEVMRKTPLTRHWFPTRMHKFDKFKATLEKMQALNNVVVRYSSDAVDGSIIEGETTSTIVPSNDPNAWPNCAKNVTLCEAGTRAGKCGDCRACWDKRVQVIAYPAHGREMLRVISKGA